MSLIDEVTIKVKGGKGGDGSKSFTINYGSQRRVPDGGNGGNGGSVYFKGSHNLNDLSEFQYKKEIKAGNGENGKHKNLFGKKGENVIVLVPLGTTIIDKKTNETVEIMDEEKEILIAKGGRKGIGNHEYKITHKFVPRREFGEEGEEKELGLVLNLIADIGLIGLPNAGKSSLLSKITNANPKIGNYAFTTLEPTLGTLGNIVIADIPGLIEGASKGKGLGHSFLKHIKKTKMLVHLLDVTSDDISKDYKTIFEELKEFDKELTQKKEIILLSKTDLVSLSELEKKEKEILKFKKKIFKVSIYDLESLEKIKKVLVSEFKNQA